jgi:phosphomannomutase
VIGYDHRKSAKAGVDSEMMALTAAAVCVSRGIKTYLFSRQVATPIVAFTVKYKGCAAGELHAGDPACPPFFHAASLQA